MQDLNYTRRIFREVSRMVTGSIKRDRDEQGLEAVEGDALLKDVHEKTVAVIKLAAQEILSRVKEHGEDAVIRGRSF